MSGEATKAKTEKKVSEKRHNHKQLLESKKETKPKNSTIIVNCANYVPC
jgi:hypothetical protein